MIISHQLLDFWLRKNEYTDQPTIVFQNQLIMYNLESNGESYGYSTVSDLNDMFTNNILSVSASVFRFKYS